MQKQLKFCLFSSKWGLKAPLARNFFKFFSNFLWFFPLIFWPNSFYLMFRSKNIFHNFFYLTYLIFDVSGTFFTVARGLISSGTVGHDASFAVVAPAPRHPIETMKWLRHHRHHYLAPSHTGLLSHPSKRVWRHPPSLPSKPLVLPAPQQATTSLSALFWARLRFSKHFMYVCVSWWRWSLKYDSHTHMRARSRGIIIIMPPCNLVCEGIVNKQVPPCLLSVFY